MDDIFLLAADSGGTKTCFRLLDTAGNIISESRCGGVASLHPGMLPVKEHLLDGISRLELGKKFIHLLYFSLGGPNIGEVESVLDEIFPRTQRIVERESNGNMILGTGALLGCSAAVMIGTGSVAVGDMNGKRFFSGGWGPVLDDRGSGAYLGLQALRL